MKTQICQFDRKIDRLTPDEDGQSRGHEGRLAKHRRLDNLDRRSDGYGRTLDVCTRTMERIKDKLDCMLVSIQNIEARSVNETAREARRDIRPVSHKGQHPKVFPYTVHAFWNMKGT